MPTQHNELLLSMSRTQAFWIVVLIAAIGIGLRSYELTARSLWFDEAFSWRLIQFPFQEMIHRDGLDVHPPLYYILLKGWSTVFGSSLLALRSFSVACAGLSIMSAYVFTAYAFRSRRAGIYAATLLALSPWCISYAWEARMYPLGMIFALLSSYALLRGLRDKSFGWFAFYGVCAAALIYTHYYGLFTIAAHVLFVLAVLVRSTKWRIGEMVQSRIFWGGLLSLCISLALFSPWLPTFLHQISQVQQEFWIPPVTVSAVSNTFYQMVAPTLHIPRYYGVSHLPVVLTVLLCLYLVLRYKNIDGVWLTVFLGSIPIGASALISLGGRSLYNDRFFAFSGIFLFILLAYALSVMKKPLVRRIVFSCVLAGVIFTAVSYWNELDIAHKGGAHEASTYIFTQATNTDPVLVSSPYVYFAMLHYATEELNATEIPHLYSKTGELSHFSGGPIIRQEDIVGPQDLTTYTGTVWVIDTTGFSEQPFAAPTNWKEGNKKRFPEVFVHQGDIVVRRFEVK